MISSRGFDDGSVQESTDLGHAVIEGTFRLQPLSQAKIEIIYTVPYTDTKTYTLFMQKQGGTENVTHTLVVNGEEHELILDKDKKVSFGF
jgi:PKD repeat protein